MNKVVLMGRLVKEPETKTTSNNKTFARFTLAVDRNKEETDFISITCWNKTAELVEKYFHKGSPIAVIGSIRTGSYDGSDGKRVYTTEVWVDNIEFVPRDKQSTETGVPSGQITKTIADLEPVSDDSGIPF